MKYIITILFFTFSINTALCCSCSRVGILKNQKSSDFIFTGKVIKINEIVTKEKLTYSNGSEFIFEYKRYEFVFKIKHIHKTKKGFGYKDEIRIITTGNEADCGYDFELNKRYLIYSYKEQYKLYDSDQKAKKEFMSTDLCTRTKRIKIFTFLEQLILELT